MIDSFRGQLPEADWYPAGVAGVTSRRVELPDGEHVRLVEAGPLGGEDVVLLHGWACSAYFFRHLVGPVAAAGYRVHALDLRGHGGSARPAGADHYTGLAMRDHALEAMTAAGVTRAHLVAHSLGGAVAIDVASTAPERVRTVTLLAPVGLAPVHLLPLARLATPRLAAPLVPYAVPRWSIPLMLRAVYGTEGRWASRDVDEYWAPTADPGFALALRELLHHYRFSPRTDLELRAVPGAPLVLLGERDLLVRSRTSAARVMAVPRWRSVTFPGAGHVLAEEVPERVLGLLLPHLGGAVATP